MSFPRPTSLCGPTVFLEPLAEQHREPLRTAANRDQSIWTYFPINFNGAGEEFDPWFDLTMERSAHAEHYPFAIRRRVDGTTVGTTRFYDMVPDHKRLAIGSTWYSPEARGTLVNPEVRLLTLTHAFESLAVNRVEMITDPENLSSQAAMRILGMVQEGVLRNHLIYRDGRIRNSIVYSIIASEWHRARDKLAGILCLPQEDPLRR